ncbi:MAG: Fur-regulated basic protein [Bacillales bacterium]|jgi:hypothetical protein|nr:Fur-regulated basic protein [Bacillales bacterium]
MRPRKTSFQELVTANKKEILSNKIVLDKIDRKVETRQLNFEYSKKNA